MDFEHMSEVDAAYHILTQRGEPLHYKDLILEVIENTHKPVQSLAMAISERVPPEVKRSSSRSSGTAAKTAITKEAARKKKLESIQN